MTRGISAMHEMFGVLPDKRCEDCANLMQGDYHGRHLRKCTVYGATHSASSDWSKKYIACGMYNREWTSPRNAMELRAKDKAQLEPCEGQMRMEDAHDQV